MAKKKRNREYLSRKYARRREKKKNKSPEPPEISNMTGLEGFVHERGVYAFRGYATGGYPPGSIISEEERTALDRYVSRQIRAGGFSIVGVRREGNGPTAFIFAKIPEGFLGELPEEEDEDFDEEGEEYEDYDEDEDFDGGAF